MSKGKIIVASMMLFCVLCFAAVAFYFLGNNTQPSNQQQTAAILQVAGLISPGKRDAVAMQTLFERRVIARQVNLDSGTLLSASSRQDAQKSCVNLATDQDPVQVRQRCNIADVYLVQNNEHQIQQVIIPVSGKGAKSMMHAFIALETDGRTVKNLLFYEQNETPMLGAKVEDPDWLRQWPGKKVLNDNAEPALKVVQQRSGDADEYTVDGITGATMTSSGVEKSINFWLGSRGYGHFLQRLAKDKQILSN
ncbi:NADH:ubiquinone reductase (Na(+)-transporting) subunit C [Escherichia coli]|nr:NADH:ubiquinone reductase (Na(+)-transporting) subunit C [Escherichia coli]